MLHFKPLKVRSVARETGNCISVDFDIPDDLADEYRWLHGQHVTLRRTVAGEELRRSYSICTPPDSAQLRIVIRKDPDGRFSSWAHEQLVAGETLDVLTPTGGFHTPLDVNNRKTYAAFAAGIGITPILSIVRTTLEREPMSRFVLFYANRNSDSILFHDLLHDLKNRYMERFSLHLFLTGEKLDNPLYSGRIDAAKIAELSQSLLPVAQIDEFFICGPSTMIDDVAGALRAAGAPSGHIHFERFLSAATPAVDAQAGSDADTDIAGAQTRVTVILDGASRDFDMSRDGEKVLDAALDAGIELPYSCMGGVCSTCRSKLLEGSVDMEVNYALEDWEIDEGYVLTCQSRPLSDKIVLDFDSG